MRVATFVALLAWTGSACSNEVKQTRALVEVYGDVRDQLAALQVEVSDPDDAEIRKTETFPVTSSRDPNKSDSLLQFVILAHPGREDARFLVSVTGSDAGGKFVVQARAIDRFVRETTVNVSIRLESKCANVECSDPTSTCSADILDERGRGRCVPICDCSDEMSCPTGAPENEAAKCECPGGTSSESARCRSGDAGDESVQETNGTDGFRDAGSRCDSGECRGASSGAQGTNQVPASGDASTGAIDGGTANDGSPAVRHDGDVMTAAEGASDAADLHPAEDGGPESASLGSGHDEGETMLPRLAVGTVHTCMVSSSGMVSCWGSNAQGQLGDGTKTDRTVPTPVAGLSDVVEVVAGGRHTCARTASASVYCWGENDDGELGDGTLDGHLVPKPVPGIADAVQLALSDSSTCARLSTGSVLCWGSDGNGAAGAGPRSTPTPVMGLSDAVDVAAGSESTHVCARSAGGAILCWAAGDSLPVPIDDVADVAELAVGFSSSCARHVSGSVSCWGSGGVAAMLAGPTTSTGFHEPTEVPGLSNVVELTVAYMHACARLATRVVACWGQNLEGERGNGTNSDAQRLDAPTFVVGLSDAVQVKAGRYHTCALRGTGAVACWGGNDYGQLGDSTTAPHYVPQPVIGLP